MSRPHQDDAEAPGLPLVLVDDPLVGRAVLYAEAALGGSALEETVEARAVAGRLGVSSLSRHGASACRHGPWVAVGTATGETREVAAEARESPAAVVTALLEATNAHDIEAFVAPFAEDYDSRQPAHPDRTHADGSRLDMAGVIPFGVRAHRLTRARLYIEAVEHGEGIEAVVRDMSGAPGARIGDDRPTLRLYDGSVNARRAGERPPPRRSASVADPCAAACGGERP